MPSGPRAASGPPCPQDRWGMDPDASIVGAFLAAAEGSGLQSLPPMSETGGAGGAGEDRVLTAFRRLLADAATGGQSKVDALVALSQRVVWVATWPGSDGFRTLTNSSGSAALPIFTHPTLLDAAARRYGWMNPDGSLPSREAAAREAFTHAIAHNV